MIYKNHIATDGISMKNLCALFLLLFSVSAHAQDVDISGFEEMTPDEFHELVAGKTMTGVHRSREYTQRYTHDRHFIGKTKDGPYAGRWKAGENNCVLVVWPSRNPRCWKLLRKDVRYIFGYYNSDGTILTMSHYVTITD